MTPTEYVDRLADLVSTGQFEAAFAVVKEHQRQMLEKMTGDQIQIVHGLMHVAESTLEMDAWAAEAQEFAGTPAGD